jgi:hypothetical protein
MAELFILENFVIATLDNTNFYSVKSKLTMANINISDLQITESEELDLLTDSEGYLKELSEQEKSQIQGACACTCGVITTYVFD